MAEKFQYSPQWQGPLSGRSFEKQTENAINGLVDEINEIESIQPSSAIPQAPGPPSAGTSPEYSRGDHIHPLQSSIDGNAATATKLATPRSITISGAVAGSAYFDGSQNITIETGGSGERPQWSAPLFAVYGGQLAELRQDLITPNKPVGISLVGDSITWGAKPSDMLVYSDTELSDHTLFQPRQPAGTLSWANLFREWLEDNLKNALNYTKNRLPGGGYQYGVERVDSDWAWTYTGVDPEDEGRSKSVMTLMQELSPFDGYFTTATTGATATQIKNTGSSYSPGYRLNSAIQFEVDLSSTSNNGSLSFEFYGDSFDLYWYAENASSMDYEILVDGDPLTPTSVFSTTTTSDIANPSAHRTHTLPTRTPDPDWPSLTALTPRMVTIRTHMSSAGTGTGKLILQSVVVPKVITYNNNSISGSSVYNFQKTAVPANGYTEAQNIAAYRTAVNPRDYAFVMFGANDRAESRNGNAITDPNGWSNSLSAEMARLVAYQCKVILMCSNPCDLRPTKDYMDMAEVHLRIMEVAKRDGYDFVDNYSIFDTFDISAYTVVDHLHPNDFGHQMIFQNVTGALLLAPGIEERQAAAVISGNNAQLAIQNTGVTRGTNPAANKVASVRFVDSAGTTSTYNTTGFVRSFVNADGTTQLLLSCYQNSLENHVVAMSLNYPASGSPYISCDAETRYSGEIVENADIRLNTADGDRRIYGYSGGSSTAGKNRVSIHAANYRAYGAQLDLVGKRGTPSGDTPDPDAGCFMLTAQISSSSAYTHTLRGASDGSLTWDGLEIQTAASPSDERIKTALADIPDAVLDAWGDVQWGQFQFQAAVEQKGEAARLHAGLVAQKIRDAFAAHGLDACKYGVLCHDEWDDEYTEDENGNQVLFRPAGDLWTVRYLEALAIEAAYQRRYMAQIEARMQAIENKQI